MGSLPSRLQGAVQGLIMGCNGLIGLCTVLAYDAAPWLLSFSLQSCEIR